VKGGHLSAEHHIYKQTPDFLRAGSINASESAIGSFRVSMQNRQLMGSDDG